jgi:hypothetical protein
VARVLREEMSTKAIVKRAKITGAEPNGVRLPRLRTLSLEKFAGEADEPCNEALARVEAARHARFRV